VSNARLIAQSKPDITIDWNVVAGVADSIGSIFKQADLKCIAVTVGISGCDAYGLSNMQVGIGAGDAMAVEARSEDGPQPTRRWF